MLDRYPPKAGTTASPTPLPISQAVTAPPKTAARPEAPAHPPSTPAPSPTPAPPPTGLISLDRPFDVDDFSQSLGETQVRVVVPREDLPEVLRRVMDFMGFGIYVYSIRVSPEDSDTLRRFVVELQRVDYSAARRTWVAFEEKGRADSPFGPGGRSP